MRIAPEPANPNVKVSPAYGLLLVPPGMVKIMFGAKVGCTIGPASTQVSVTVEAEDWTLPRTAALGSRITLDESAESVKVTVTP